MKFARYFVWCLLVPFRIPIWCTEGISLIVFYLFVHTLYHEEIADAMFSNMVLAMRDYEPITDWPLPKEQS